MMSTHTQNHQKSSSVQKGEKVSYGKKFQESGCLRWKLMSQKVKTEKAPPPSKVLTLTSWEDLRLGRSEKACKLINLQIVQHQMNGKLNCTGICKMSHKRKKPHIV